MWSKTHSISPVSLNYQNVHLNFVGRSLCNVALHFQMHYVLFLITKCLISINKILDFFRHILHNPVIVFLKTRSKITQKINCNVNFIFCQKKMFWFCKDNNLLRISNILEMEIVTTTNHCVHIHVQFGLGISKAIPADCSLC